MLNYNLKTIIFQCSKNYGSPTRVTSIVASNMADPVLTKTDRSLKWTLLALVCHLLSVYGLSVGFFLKYSFLYMQIILLFINMQVSKREAGQQVTACHYPPFKSCRYWTPRIVFVGLSWINRRHHSLTSSLQAEFQ